MAPSLEHETPKEGETVQLRGYEVTQKLISDLNEEKQRLGENFPLCSILIEEAIERALFAGRIPGKEFYADVLKQKPIKVVQKVFLPVKQYPKFNFIGKILGPKGNSLRRVQEETGCKVAVKGRNSMRDRAKEEELYNSGDPKYAHFNKDLFLEISTVGPPAECHGKMANALTEIRKYIIPDKNDEVSQEQFRESIEINPEATKSIKNHMYKSSWEKTVINGAEDTSKYRNLVKSIRGEGTQEYVPMQPYGRVMEAAPPYKRMQPGGYFPDTKRPRGAPLSQY